MENRKNVWPKSISVDKRIVKILSEQTYEYLPNAIKELITNSYDADASQVSIIIDTFNESITIEDDGWGMDEEQFNFYLTIAGQKRRKNATTPSGRRVIGQFGVGFLAVFPFFQVFNIETKRKGISEVVLASIPCYKYFTNDRIIDISDIKIEGQIIFRPELRNKSYTKITLNGFTDLGKRFFFPENKLKPRKFSIQNFNPLEKLIWRLEEDLPIDYQNDRFREFTADFSPNLPFAVMINNKKLSRKVYGLTILDQSTKIKEFGKIQYKYFIVTNKEPVNPNEAKYFKIRNQNAGVGDRTNFGLGSEVGGGRSRMHWLTGEIIIINGLNDQITVSRDSFNYSEDYENLKAFFIRKLTTLSNLLEAEEEIQSFVVQKAEDVKIKNIKFLDPEIVSRKVSRLKARNPVPEESENQFVDLPKKIAETKLKIGNKTYVVELGSWNYNDDIFPALKIEKNKVIVNNNYPLFKGRKYTDIFIKFHILLTINYLEKKFNKGVFAKLTSDLSDYFSDYAPNAHT